MDFKKDEKYYQECVEVMESGILDGRSKQYRTYKEYREWYENEGHKQNKGLGDVVESITEATGIKKAVKAIAGEDCGCDKRKEVLNKTFRYKVFECLAEDDYNYLVKFFSVSRSRVTRGEQEEIYRISNYVFGRNQTPSSCPSCLRNVVKGLKKVLDEY